MDARPKLNAEANRAAGGGNYFLSLIIIIIIIIIFYFQYCHSYYHFL